MLLLQHLLVLVCPIDCGLLRLPRGARLRTHHLNVPEFYRHRFTLVNHLPAFRCSGGAHRPGRRSPSWTSSPRSAAANHFMPRLDRCACATLMRGRCRRTVGRRAGHACAGRDRRTDRLGPPRLGGSTAGRSSARLAPRSGGHVGRVPLTGGRHEHVHRHDSGVRAEQRRKSAGEHRISKGVGAMSRGDMPAFDSGSTAGSFCWVLLLGVGWRPGRQSTPSLILAALRGTSDVPGQVASKRHTTRAWIDVTPHWAMTMGQLAQAPASRTLPPPGRRPHVAFVAYARASRQDEIGSNIV